MDVGEDATVEASPRYVIDALSVGPPIVSIREPGRDGRATAIDEVYIETAAEDDYGLGSVELRYAVGGGLAEVSAGHTLFLEEYGLEPGDLVAYYAGHRQRRRGRPENRPPATSTSSRRCNGFRRFWIGRSANTTSTAACS